MKKIVSLLLCLVLVAMALVSCGGDAGMGPKEAERPNLTLKVGIIVDDRTTAEGIAAMQKNFNNLSSVALSTKVEFVCMTADEYKTKMDAEMTRLQNGGALADINKENAKAESTGTDTTTVDLNAYPEATDTQFDILLITGEDMYREYVQNGWIISLNDAFDGTYKVLKTKVIDEAMAMVQIDGHCYAIPAAEAYGEYTYLKVNKNVLAACNIPEKDITDLASAYQIFRHLDSGDEANGVSYWRTQYESFSPVLNSKDSFDYVGVQYVSPNGTSSLIGATYSVNENHNIWYSNNMTSSFNLLDNQSYRRYVEMAFDFDKKGYFGDDTAKDCIMGIVKGDYGLRNKDADNYMYVTLSNPTVGREEVFDSMLAVSSFTVNKNRSIELLQELMTNATGAGLLNVMLYGEETENYSLSDDGVVELRVSYSYAMHPDYFVGNLAENAYTCSNYGHDADTFSNIHLQNHDLKVPMFDSDFDSYFDSFDRTEEGDWAKVDAYCNALYEGLYEAETLEEFRANIDAVCALLADVESEDPNVQLYQQIKGSAPDEFGTLMEAIFKYVTFRISNQ